MEDCADGCSAHPDCKAFVLGYWEDPPACYLKSVADSNALIVASAPWTADSGLISTCYYSKWVKIMPAAENAAGGAAGGAV